MNIKVRNLLRTMCRKCGKHYAESVQKESAVKESSTDSHWESELRLIRINRKTGEKIIEK